MRFFFATVLAFAATAFAQDPDFDPVYTPKSGETITTGSPYKITWGAPLTEAHKEGTISIELIGGPTQNDQDRLGYVASGIKNSAKEYTWNVATTINTTLAFYGLVFRYESDPEKTYQYSQPFLIRAAEKDDTSSNGVTTMTKSQGVKTVTLSSSTPVTTTSAPATTSHTKVKHNTTALNTTTLVQVTSSQSAPVVITSTDVVNPTTTAPTNVPTPTAGANAIRVGSLTILGVVAAVLLL